MIKNRRSSHPTHSGAPLTAEATERLIQDTFSDTVPHYGESLIPNDQFYGHDTGPVQARYILHELCRWLGIKPGYIRLDVGSFTAGASESHRYKISIPPEIVHDEFRLAALLSYALSRYLITEQKQIQSTDTDHLVALGSIMFGLGFVIANGLSPQYGWADSWKQKFKPVGTDLLGRYPEASYYHALNAFIKKQRLSFGLFQYALTPWAAKRLHIKSVRYTSHAVSDSWHQTHLANLKFAGGTWLVMMAIGTGIFVIGMRVKPPSPAIIDAQEQLTLLTALVQNCKQTVVYERQYADLTDIQTVRKLNGDDLRCQSLNNQRTAAERSYLQIIESRK